MSPRARLRFARRTSLFHAEPEEGTVLEIDFGQGTPHVFMPSSDAGGRTGLRTTVALTPDPRFAPWLRFHARVAGPARRIEGRALLVPAQGLSVISDIDDTVKVTQVRDQQQMLLNTFVRAFEAVPGMAQHYLIGLGADPKKFQVSGAGEAKPIADNTTPEGRAKNRRVEVEVVGVGK